MTENQFDSEAVKANQIARLEGADLHEELHYHSLHCSDAETDLAGALAEIDRLGGLIDRTAKHWLSIQPGIPWEGAIDGAMKAGVEEIGRLKRGILMHGAAVADVMKYGPENRRPVCPEWSKLVVEGRDD